MGGLFKQPKIPKTPPPVPMPEEATLNAAKRRKFAMILKRSGPKKKLSAGWTKSRYESQVVDTALLSLGRPDAAMLILASSRCERNRRRAGRATMPAVATNRR